MRPDLHQTHSEPTTSFRNSAIPLSVQRLTCAAAFFLLRRPKNLQNEQIFLHLKIAEIDMGVNFGSRRTILDIKLIFLS